MMTQAEQTQIAYTLGIMPQAGWATGYPDLVRMLNRIYSDKIAGMPWVPRSWLAATQAIQAKFPTDLMRPTPALDGLGRRSALAPSWADTDAKLAAWGTIYDTVNDAIKAYGAAQQEIGRGELAALEADAAFWDGAYRLAVTVRNLPANVVGAVGGGISSFVGTFLPESLKAYAKAITWALALLIIGGLVLWYRKRFAGLLKGLKVAK